MAMTEMNYMSGGGKSKRGTFQVNTSSATVVHELGFKPQYLIVTKNAYPNENTVLVYDADLDANKQTMGYYDNGAAGWLQQSVPSSRVDCIASIDDEGFTFNKTDSAALAGTYYYYAIE